METFSLEALSLEQLSLLSLPNELLELIIDYLSDEQRDSLTLVNKRLCSIVQRTSFKTIIIRWPTPSASRQVANLHRILRDNPPLRNLIKNFTMKPADTNRFRNRVYAGARVPVHELGKDHIHYMVAKLGCQEKWQLAMWRFEAEAGTPWTMAVLLIAQMPRLERLELCGAMADYQDGLGAAIGQRMRLALTMGHDRHIATFGSLKSIHFNSNIGMRHNYPVLQPSALGVFNLPSLESLSIDLPFRTEATWAWGEVPVAPLLKKLHVSTFHDDQQQTVERILKACPSLQSLSWSSLWRREDTDGFSLTRLSSVLQAAASPVRSLVLDTEREPPSFHTETMATALGVMTFLVRPEPIVIDDPASFVSGKLSLASLAHVESLSLTWVHLFGLVPDADLVLGGSTFPSQLKKLRISSTNLSIEEHHLWGLFERVAVARNFVIACRRYAPKLTEIKFGSGLFTQHPMEVRIRIDLDYIGETKGVCVCFDDDCFAEPIDEDEELPEDWEWLVPDESEDSDMSDESD